MKDVTILIVDDETDMRQLVKLYLEKEGFRCMEAANGQEALDLLNTKSPQLILLDVMMPKMDGFTVAAHIRQKRQIPIIFLTARGDEWDRIHGLNLGADDYMMKPFSFGELIARVQAVLRRTQPSSPKPELLQVGPLSINKKGRQVFFNNQPISLTLKEYELLQFLCDYKGQVFSREQLLEKIWGYDYEGSERTVDTHIKTLRLKLKEGADILHTVWGVGYKVEV
ncbi:DNA-binding response OmpR family regulator [Bacillus fengqiuensis]|nr:DNA-binding response OmpR family regulator [Bacillus fengqiuensis]